MKEEFYRDLENLKAKMQLFEDWAEESRNVGTMTFLQGMKKAYDDLTEAKKEMDLWFL